MAQTTVTAEGKDYTLRTGGDMSVEAQSESIDSELDGFEEDGSDVERVFNSAKINEVEGLPTVGDGTYIAVNTAPNGKAAIFWKYFNGGNPDTTRWFPQ